VWEAFETVVVRALLATGETFIDLGANIGWYTIVGCLTVGRKGRVYAFEPDPKNFALLRQNVALNRLRRATLVPRAVSDRRGEALLHLSPENMGDHRLYDSKDGRAAVRVQVTSLDAYFGAITRSRVAVSLIKIDTQGSEARILTGFQRLHCRNAGRIALIVEFCPYGLTTSGSAPAQLLNCLRGLACDCFLIDELSCSLRAITPDVLAARAETDLQPATQRFVNLLVVPRGGRQLLRVRSLIGEPWPER